jgi:hypothetical protein
VSWSRDKKRFLILRLLSKAKCELMKQLVELESMRVQTLLRLFDNKLTYSADGLLKETALSWTITSRVVLQGQDMLLVTSMSVDDVTSLGILKTLLQRWNLPPGLHLQIQGKQLLPEVSPGAYARGSHS